MLEVNSSINSADNIAGEGKKKKYLISIFPGRKIVLYCG